MAEGDPQGSGQGSNRPNRPGDDPRTSQRVFKKTSSNNKITLYIAHRELVLEPNQVKMVEGVLLIDPEYAENRNIFGQIIVIFRYGRQDEEIMGLQFFNENLVNMVKIWPECDEQRRNITLTSPLQEALVKRLGPNAIPFHLELYNTAPPSVVLSPTKPYTGQPVGTSYEVRVFMGEEPGDMVHRPVMVRMGIRVTHSAARIDTAPLLTPSPSNESFRVKPRYQRLKVQRRRRARVVEDPPDPVTEDESAPFENGGMNGENTECGDQGNNQGNAVNKPREERNYMERSENGGGSNRAEERSYNNEEIQGNEDFSVTTESVVPFGPRPAPRVTVEKSFLLSDGNLHLESWLDRSSYHHGERVVVNFRIVNNSRKTVHRIKAYAIQYVDVCMFDNGKFKNVVAMAKDSSSSVPPGQRFHDYYSMRPRRVLTKNWIALETPVSFPDGCLASTVVCEPEDVIRRGLYSIFVSYYVKLTLFMNKLGGELSVKLPFSLSHAPIHESPADSSTESGNRTYVEEGDSPAENDDSKEKNEKKDDSKEDCRQKDDNEEEHTFKNADDEDVKDGNAPIGNQVPNSEVNLEGRQTVSADVTVNIIENQLGVGPQFQGIPLVRVAKPDEDELNPIVHYRETNI